MQKLPYEDILSIAGAAPDELADAVGDTVAPPASGWAHIRPGGKRHSTTKKSEAKENSVRNVYNTGGMIDRAMELENLPFMQDQKLGIQNLEEQIRMAAGAEDNSGIIAPLLSLVDAQTGSKFAGPYAAANKDKKASLLDAEEGLLRRKSDFSKNMLDALTKSKEGTDTKSSLDSLTAMVGAGFGSGAFGTPEERYARQAHQRVLSAVKGSTILKNNRLNMDKIENALNNAVGVEKLTPESFHELQQAIRSSITKGTGGVNERAQTYYKSLGMTAQEFVQWLDSKPQSLKKNDPFVKHVLEIGQLELGNIKRQTMNEVKKLTAGNRSVYENFPDLKMDLEDLTGNLEESYTPTIDPKIEERLKPKKKEGAPAAATGKPKVIKRLGKDGDEYEYTLNEQTGEYE
jgi:hypothetical protein